MPPAPGIHVHTCLVPIRWGDMDAYRHVNNAVYFSYMEQACAEFISSLGFRALSAAGPVVVNSACSFLRPLTYPGMAEVNMFCASPGNSSFLAFYEVRLQGEDSLYARGQMKMVWVDRATGKSTPLPDEIRARLSLPSLLS
ncbi:MAG: acyl-CoA thioesterase [Candidatus Accumulibacter sp.]|nr:acyl-CoA thioesterase [Accumulibacter sp.]